MADDWIKVRENLHEQPEILAIASELDARPEHIVGYCIRFWGWVSRNVSPNDRDKCPGGCVTNVPLVSVEAVLNLPGFLGLLCKVGWLKYEIVDGKHVITVPKMDKHLSETAKKRAEEAEKKRKQRSKQRPENVPGKSGHCPEKTGTREEKRREEKSNKDIDIPPTNSLKIIQAREHVQRLFLPAAIRESPEAMTALAEWQASRRATQGSFTDEVAWSQIAAAFNYLDSDGWVAALNLSTRLGAKNLQVEDFAKRKGQQPKKDFDLPQFSEEDFQKT